MSTEWSRSPRRGQKERIEKGGCFSPGVLGPPHSTGPGLSPRLPWSPAPTGLVTKSTPLAQYVLFLTWGRALGGQ